MYATIMRLKDIIMPYETFSRSHVGVFERQEKLLSFKLFRGIGSEITVVVADDLKISTMVHT